MTKIVRYLFGVDYAKQISTITINGQHWYAARDLCNILGIDNHSTAVHRKRIKDELTLKVTELTKVTIYNGRKRKKMLLVNNGGMLKLIFQARSEFAKKAQDLAQNTPANLIPSQWDEYITIE